MESGSDHYRETKSVMQRSRSGPHLLVTMGIIGPLQCSVDIILVSRAKDTYKGYLNCFLHRQDRGPRKLEPILMAAVVHGAISYYL